MFDVTAIRKDFPILSRKVNGRPLVYLDNAATSQKPQQVIDCIVDYYSSYNANIHRGVHALSQEATDVYEASRKKIQTHFGIAKPHEVIFTSGTTHGINIVANGFASILSAGDEIIVSQLEHHSNIVPWQMLCKTTGAILRVIPMNQEGGLDMDAYQELLCLKTKLVFVNHISNTLGTINPIEFMTQKAHQVGAAILIDGAQSCSHIRPDLTALDCDFYVTSAHKMCGPTGVGMLYGKEAWLEKLPPFQGGGEMIDYATKKLLAIDGLKIYGTTKEKTSVISFNIEGIHPYDIGTIVDKLGVAVRTGQHCTQPIMDFFNISGTVRASFAFYNTIEEIDIFVAAVEKAKMMLS